LMLLDRARALGADVREETRVDDVAIDARGVTVSCTSHRGEPYSLKAQVFVDATGRDALIAGRLGLKEPDGLIATNVAVHTTYADLRRGAGPEAGNITVGLFDGGWWWQIPFKDGDTSVGLVFEKSWTLKHRGDNPEAMMDAAIEKLLKLRTRLAPGRRILPVG